MNKCIGAISFLVLLGTTLESQANLGSHRIGYEVSYENSCLDLFHNPWCPEVNADNKSCRKAIEGTIERDGEEVEIINCPPEIKVGNITYNRPLGVRCAWNAPYQYECRYSIKPS